MAGLSDVLDGIVARRLGPSRIGEVLDPIVDKIFMLAAVLTVVTPAAGVRLGGWEINKASSPPPPAAAPHTPARTPEKLRRSN